MLNRSIVIDTEKVRGYLDEVVRSTVEATLNLLLDEEADRIGSVAPDPPPLPSSSDNRAPCHRAFGALAECPVPLRRSRRP
jgi:hypothetical protein